MLGGMFMHKEQRGDTIIEVLFAITVFSLVAIGGLSIMNSGVASAQRSLEITLVRQQIDAQSEALRFVHHSYVSAYTAQGGTYTGAAAVWKDIVDNHTVGAAANFGVNPGVTSCPSIPSHSFVMNARTAKISGSAPKSMSADGSRPYSQLVYGDDEGSVALAERDLLKSADGIWVEAVQNSSGDELLNRSSFVDFHIRACWNSPGAAVPMTIGTIVRLYEPRG